MTDESSSEEKIPESPTAKSVWSRIIDTSFWTFACVTMAMVGTQVAIDLFDLPRLFPNDFAPKSHMRGDYYLAGFVMLNSAFGLLIATILTQNKGLRRLGIVVLICSVIWTAVPRY